MSFALCPDDGPPRIWRFEKSLPDNVLCRLDPNTNVLTIDRTKFDTLTKMQQGTVLKTQAVIITLDDGQRYAA